ncbi:hypothetical protein LTSEINV_4221, partial [Salmonella enterica subsp. enterica serovar Inverness str. R8-3668]
MEKVEKRLTDLSGALAHNYPEIKLHFILQDFVYLRNI